MPTDTRVIVGIHECLRKEFASLPLRVKAVAVDDGERAAVVGRHVLVMCDLLEAHDRAQARVVRPLVADRAPASVEVVDAAEIEGRALTDAIPAVRAQVLAWQDDATVLARATIHTTLIGFERLLLARLGTEEAQMVPLLAEVLEPGDVDAVLAAGLATLPDDEVPPRGRHDPGRHQVGGRRDGLGPAADRCARGVRGDRPRHVRRLPSAAHRRLTGLVVRSSGRAGRRGPCRAAPCRSSSGAARRRSRCAGASCTRPGAGGTR